MSDAEARRAIKEDLDDTLIVQAAAGTGKTTELVNRMYVRLAGSKISLRDRGHFFAIEARVMRRELIDYFRNRPHAAFLPIEGLPEGVLAKSDKRDLVLAINELLVQRQRCWRPPPHKETIHSGLSGWFLVVPVLEGHSCFRGVTLVAATVLITAVPRR